MGSVKSGFKKIGKEVKRGYDRVKREAVNFHESLLDVVTLGGYSAVQDIRGAYKDQAKQAKKANEQAERDQKRALMMQEGMRDPIRGGPNRRASAGSQQTLLTGSLGAAGEKRTRKKTLLGQ